MPNPQEPADQLMCDHRWVKAREDAEPACAVCGLGHAEYTQGTVRAALTRMGVWD